MTDKKKIIDPPSSIACGTRWYNPDEKKYYIFDGKEWIEDHSEAALMAGLFARMKPVK